MCDQDFVIENHLSGALREDNTYRIQIKFFEIKFPRGILMLTYCVG